MKYNYLVSSYNSLLTKYQKYFSRLQRDIHNGSFNKLSATRKNFLVRKVEELRAKLAALQPRLTGVIATAGLLLALNTPQAEAQFVFNSAKNPFVGSPNTVLIPFAHSYGSQSSPVLVDLDGDGDKDAVVGSVNNAEYFKNTGTASAPVFTAQTGTFNPFASLGTGYINEISMADLDNDGDFDLIVGTYNGTSSPYQILYFQNTGTSSAAAFTQQAGTFNPIPMISGTSYTSFFPSFVDIDGDGDKDIFAGFAGSPNTSFLKNTGTISSPVFVEQAATDNPLSVITGGGYAIPTFVDIDGDGDFDAVVSNYNSSFSYYENTGSATTPVFTLQTGTNSPFSIFRSNANFLNSSFADLDGDGDQDMVVGDNSNEVTYYKNKGTASAASFDFPLGSDPKPAFADLDGDGDKDAIFGNSSLPLTYAQNNGPASAPVFVYMMGTGTSNPFHNINLVYLTAPALTDIDADGDLDMLIGENNGNFYFYRNTGTTTAAIFTLQSGSAYPLFTENVGQKATPTFVDLDNDGDKDIVTGHYTSISTNGLIYYKNTGTASASVYTLQTGTNSPLPATTSYSSFTPTFMDVDGDGDQDLIVGNTNAVLYYKNTGTVSAPVFTAITGTNNPFAVVVPVGTNNRFAPAFMDVDHDGDMDLFVGKYDGTVDLYENTTTASVTGILAPLSASFSEAVSTYPNPVKDVLSFSLNDGIGSNMQAAVLDMSGTEQMSMRFENSGATMSLNVSKLNAGIYVLKLSSDAKAAVVKFVKQ